MKNATALNQENMLLIQEILAVMDELTAVMAEEVEMLPKNDIKAYQTLTLRKHKLLSAYETKMKAIALQPTLLKQAPDSLRIKLKAASAKFGQVTERNAHALRTAAQCSQRLINHIIKHVKEEALPKHGYTDPRKAHMLGVYSPTCPAVAVNRTA